MKVFIMKNFSLKKSIRLFLITIILGGSSFIIGELHAAIPTGQLNEQEYQYVLTIMQQMKDYTENIILVTNDLFRNTTPFQQDLTTFNILRDNISTIHGNITKTGSPFAQHVIGNLKGLAQHLMMAQIRWVETLQSKSLITMGSNRGFMAARYDDALRFILGARNSNNTRTGEGLIGCFEKAQYHDLKAEFYTIHKNINFSY